MDIKKLRQDRADAFQRAKEIHASAGPTGILTADAEAKYSAEMATIASTDKAIARAEALLDAERTAPAAVAFNTSDAVQVRESISAGHNNRQDQAWSGMGEFLRAVKNHAKTQGRVSDPRLYAFLGQNETIDAEGGFLVAPEMSDELLTRTYADGPIVSRCSRMNMSSSRLVINGVEDSNRIGGPAGAGVVTYRIGEAQNYIASKIKFRRVEFNANKLIALFYATDEVLDDAPALMGQLKKYIPKAFRWKLENEVLNGTGVGEFLGINLSGATVVTPKQAGQATGTFLAQNVLDMHARFWVYSRPNGVWITGPDVEANLYTMTLPGAAGTSPAAYTPPGVNGNNTPYGRLLNMPVIVVEQTAPIGTQGDIMLADFSEYQIAERLGSADDPVFASSIHVAFLTGEQAWRWTLRNDGQPLWDKPVTQNNSANKVSPFVTLASRP